MSTFLSVICAWYALGVTGFIYHWTKEFSLKVNDIPLTLFTSLMGPLTFLIGYVIHSDKVLIKRRK